MINRNYLDVVRAYEKAITDLYARPVSELAERGAGELRTTAELPELAETLINRSKELGEATAERARGGTSEQRELAQLQILAAAAIDLHVASDLVQRSEEGVAAGVVERDVSLPGAIASLRPILTADPDKGIGPLLSRSTERVASSREIGPAKTKLQDEVKVALEDIRDDAATVCQATLKNLLLMPLPAIKNAVQVAVAEILAKLGESVSRLLRMATTLVVQAVQKLLSIFNQDAQEEARKQATEWIDELKNGGLFATLLDRLYELERIRDEVKARIEGTESEDAAPFNRAATEVSDLAAKFHKYKETITWVLHGLSWAQPWIMGLQPWGPIALGTGYVANIACAVYVSGDYVDWYRPGLNIVPGVRSVVARDLHEQKQGTSGASNDSPKRS